LKPGCVYSGDNPAVTLFSEQPTGSFGIFDGDP
jgi:hypothetical protein